MRIQGEILIPLSLLVAFLLMLLPMPDWSVGLRPSWVLMVIIYWAILRPDWVNVGVAWISGIFLDVLGGTLLGEHAMALTLVTYLVIRVYPRIRMFPIIQQGIIIFLLVLLNQFILFCVQGFLGELPQNRLYWASPVTSMLLWPWLFTLLGSCRRKLTSVYNHG